jgi:hypothetical protein
MQGVVSFCGMASNHRRGRAAVLATFHYPRWKAFAGVGIAAG